MISSRDLCVRRGRVSLTSESMSTDSCLLTPIVSLSISVYVLLLPGEESSRALWETGYWTIRSSHIAIRRFLGLATFFNLMYKAPLGINIIVEVITGPT